MQTYNGVIIAIDYLLIDNFGSTARTSEFYSAVKLAYGVHELGRANEELLKLAASAPNLGPSNPYNDLHYVCIGENSERDGRVWYTREDGTEFTIDPWTEGFLEEVFDRICE